jgi:hypothetical protein
MRPPSTTATSAPKAKKRASEPRSTAALEAKAKKQRRAPPKKVPEQAGYVLFFSCLIPFLSFFFMLIFFLSARLGLPSSSRRAAAPGRLRASRRRLRDKGGSRLRSLHRVRPGRHRLRVLRLPQGRLPSPCPWLQRPAAMCGPSQRASRRWTTCSRVVLVFWIRPPGPAKVCRLRPELELAGLRRLRPELELVGLRRLRPEPEPGRAWWCWWRARRGKLRRRRWLRRPGQLLRPGRLPRGSRQGRSRRARRTSTRAHW